jgi:hypothetical protein
MFRSTDTVLASTFAVPRSGLPSPFRSPIATEAGLPSGCVVAPGPEAAIASVGEHGDGVRAEVRVRQVRLAVTVEVADRDRGRARSGCVIALALETAVALLRSTATVLALPFAVARSGLPSLFRSPIATE